MSEIWNLNAICRCCHADGNFKNLNVKYFYEGCSEVYSDMMRDTFNINITVPYFEGSNMICDCCIEKLRNASHFKRQVLICEKKFEEYVNNEATSSLSPFVSEDIKEENNYDANNLEIKQESTQEVSSRRTSDPEDCIKEDIDIGKDKNIKGKIITNKTVSKNPIKRNLIKKLSCEHCKRKFINPDTLKQHTYIHTREQTFACDECGQKFMHKKTLKRHILRHTGGVESFVCHICAYSFTNRTNLKIHIDAVHYKIKLHKCTVCSKSFAAKKNLKLHLRLHTNERPYKCNVCEKAFRDSTSLKYHKIRHKEKNDRKETKVDYTCKHCGEGFDHRGLYMSHIRSHVELKTLICDYCGNNFSCKYSLKRHITIHSGLKKFKCEYCGVKFTTKYQVKRHYNRLHDNKTKELLPKVKCKICKKTFRDMEQHLKSHTEKRFSCQFCDKKYSQGNALNAHIKRKHSGIKYKCELCGKSYTQKNSLKNHKLKVHNSKVSPK